jgi:hypothetical protein
MVSVALIMVMANKNPKWKQFETIIAEIHQQLAPNAVVQHNQQIIGKSGNPNQFDVTVSQKIGDYPILVVIECKDQKRAVAVGLVREFAERTRDIGANLGVIISTSGFAKGAKAVARQNKIILRTYREAAAEDWHHLLGNKAWLSYIEPKEIEIKQVQITYQGTPKPFLFNSHLELFNHEGVLFGTLKELILQRCEILLRDNLIPLVGLFDLAIVDTGLFLKDPNSTLWKIEEIHLKLYMRATKYILNLQLDGGQVLEDAQSFRPVYKKMRSKSFNWKEAIQNDSGIEYTVEEYEKTLQESKTIQFIKPNPHYPYIRITLTQGDGKEE